MRDKAKTYLIDTYVADWEPKFIQMPLSTRSRVFTVRSQGPPKLMFNNRCFLDDTEEESVEDDTYEGKFAMYGIPFNEL